MRSTSYFQNMRFESFKERVDFFSGYIGEEGVKGRLRRSFGGFHQGDIEEMKLVRGFIEGSIGREGVEKLRLQLHYIHVHENCTVTCTYMYMYMYVLHVHLDRSHTGHATLMLLDTCTLYMYRTCTVHTHVTAIDTHD